MAANILVVEDEPAIQELIAVNLDRAGHHVLRAGDAEVAQRLVRDALPDLILLDWMLPGMSRPRTGAPPAWRGTDAQCAASSCSPRAAKSTDKIAGLEAGADDYITKPFSPRELVARIKAVLRRRAPQATEDVVEIGGLRLDPATHRVAAGNQAISLGPTEFRLLALPDDPSGTRA